MRGHPAVSRRCTPALLTERLSVWWFTPAPAARLAGTRITHGAFSLWYLAKRRSMLAEIHRSGTNDFAPVGPCRILSKPLPATVADRFVDATLVAAAAAATGLCYRVTGPMAGALLTWTLSYRNSWTMIFHNDNLMVLHAAALAAGPSADALSVDAWVRGCRTGPSGADARYGWPLQLASTTTVTTYALAGVAKVAGPLGWKWTSGESLRRQVAVDGVRKEAFGSPASPLAYKLYGNVTLFRILALGSMAIELLGPIAIFDRRLARLWALAAWQLHWGILAIMKIKFRYQLSGAAYASFMDLERLIRR